MNVFGYYIPLWVISASFAWIAIMSLWFLYKDKTRKIIVQYPYGDSLRKNTDVIDMPRTLVINLIVDSDYTPNDSINVDMVIRYDDLIKGTYKVPDQYLKKGSEKEIKNVFKEEDVILANNTQDDFIVSSTRKVIQEELDPNKNNSMEEPFLDFTEENLRAMEELESSTDTGQYPSEEEINRIFNEDSETDYFNTENFSTDF